MNSQLNWNEFLACYEEQIEREYNDSAIRPAISLAECKQNYYQAYKINETFRNDLADRWLRYNN